MRKRYFINLMILVLSILCTMCTAAQSKRIELTDSDNNAYRVRIGPRNLQISIIEKNGKILVPSDTLTGLFINESPVVQTKIHSEKKNKIELNVVTQNNEKAVVTFSFDKGVVKISVIPQTNGKNAVSLRFGGMPLAHGLGDAGAWGKSFNLVENKNKLFDIVNNGGSKRWLSTFTIFPENDFAGVFFDRGKKNVVLGPETYQMNIEANGTISFYLFVGSTKSIYSNYKRVRNELGFQDIQPKARLFELGWESWDALGWRANQKTVKAAIEKFHSEGYPIRWAVTGSGFWEKGGTTTNFGKWGEKFPNPEEFKAWMHKKNIYLMIGLRTNFVPNGGPFVPISTKRDRNLKGNSYNGNPISDEMLENNYYLKGTNEKPAKYTSRWFPQVPCYLLDGNIPGASVWFQKQYAKWKVDGIKEDTMMDVDFETSVFNKPVSKIATEGGLVMARCGEFSSPGTLQRINDTGVSNMQKRTPINYMQYAACGAPNVYSDVAGIHNMHNIKAIDANIRHTWLLSLTSGMAVGAFPSKWPEQEQAIFKKAVDFHYSLVPYLYGAGMKSFETGYPFTLTPMSIAFSKDKEAVDLENFQWMIGESVLATPLLKNYKDGKKNIYLPKGTWFDWETGEKFTGPLTLSNYEIPLNKVPCFVGGNGIVILRNNKTDELTARVYEVGQKATTDFYTLKEGKKYQFDVLNTNLDKVNIKNTTTDEAVSFNSSEGFIEFSIVEGQDYEIK